MGRRKAWDENLGFLFLLSFEPQKGWRSWTEALAREGAGAPAEGDFFFAPLRRGKLELRRSSPGSVFCHSGSKMGYKKVGESNQ